MPRHRRTWLGRVTSLDRLPRSAALATLLGVAISCGARTDLDPPVASASGGAPRDPVCGDGVVDVGEECDDANDRDDDACVAGCTFATCGDGFVRADVEACDPGATDRCSSTCGLPTCGDGVVDSAEACDGGPDCGPGCLFATCGDGVVAPRLATMARSTTMVLPRTSSRPVRSGA